MTASWAVAPGIDTIVDALAAMEKKISHIEGKEGTNRELIKALSRRLNAVEQGDPPAPQDRPDALRWDEV